MISRHLPFLANSPDVSGTVTRFAIVSCKLDLTLRVAVLKLALDWVLSERAEGKVLDAVATPWQATFYRRDKSGRAAAVAVVEVSAADAVDERGAEGRQFRFRVEVEFGLPLDGPLPPLEATIRRVERVFRSPSADMIGYTDTPDLDPGSGAFAPDVAGWLQHGSIPAGSGIDAFPDSTGAPEEPPPPQSPMHQLPEASVLLPAARRDATTATAGAPKALEPQRSSELTHLLLTELTQ